jgi:hypothetical protein
MKLIAIKSLGSHSGSFSAGRHPVISLITLCPIIVIGLCMDKFMVEVEIDAFEQGFARVALNIREGFSIKELGLVSCQQTTH